MKEKLFSEEIAILKKHGLRATPQRMQILQAFISLKGHPTIEDIHREIPYISVNTVYKNVNLFVNMQILNELPYGNGLSRYEFFKVHHYHVICELCGDIVDFEFPKLIGVEELAGKLSKYKIHNYKMEINGICSRCQNGLKR
jgi:Fur family peroxide stress response transcriptional regulator